MKIFITALCIGFFSPLTAQKSSKYMEKGIRFFYEEKYQNALIKFQKESKREQTCDTKFWIGSCYFKMEDFSRAKDLFLKIFNDTCTGIDVGYSIINVASCYAQLNEVENALFYYDVAIDQFPELHSKAYFNKGQLLYSHSRFVEAKACYDLSIAQDSSDYFVFMKRQEVAFILNDYQSGLKDLLRAKELKGDLEIETNLAYCYTMLSLYYEADSIYQLNYDETDYLFLNNYGFNKHKLGKSAEGAALIQKSLELKPDNSYAYRNLAIIAIDNGNLEEACEDLYRAKELNFFNKYGTEVDSLIIDYCK